MKRISVTMDGGGRLTMPAAVRKRLHLSGETAFLVEIDEAASSITLRAAETVPREDAWAYSSVHLRRLERSLEQAERGEIISGSDVKLPD